MLLNFDQLLAFLSSILLPLWDFFRQLDIPIPIGFIGLWRWGVWLMRRIIGLWYRPLPPNNFRASTAVITPVYNEEPDLFRQALRSWAANGPDEIIAVIDHTDTACMAQFREFAAESAHLPIALQMLITQTPGKRPALADGILAAKSEIVFLVDSDTIWDPDVLLKSLAPFTEEAVGGVTVRQRVLNPGSTSQRLFDVYLDIRYIDEIRFLTAFGDVVTCLSGRTAVYRRAVALTALEDLMEETFWGRPVISGDDKALTLAVQSRGWKVRYQGNTCVYTPGATDMKVFLKQRLRWARNSWRADLKALGSGWAWRNPLFAFHLCDRLLQPLTTLVAPLYLGFALYHGKWQVILALISWWAISRTIKIWPHLERNWTNIRILPWYIAFNYWSAVMKIYALFTMNQQGWITRWSRGSKSDVWLKSLRAMPSYLATAATVGLVALFIQSIHETPAHADDGKQALDSPTIVTKNIVLRPALLQVLPRQNAARLRAATVNQSTATAPTYPVTARSALPQPTLPQSAGSASTTPERVAPIVALVQTMVPTVTTPTAVTLPQLCVLDGAADGICQAYRIAAPPEASAPQLVMESNQRWFALDHWWSDRVQPQIATFTATMLPPATATAQRANPNGVILTRSDATLRNNLFCVTVDGEESCIEYK